MEITKNIIVEISLLLLIIITIIYLTNILTSIAVNAKDYSILKNTYKEFKNNKVKGEIFENYLWLDNGYVYDIIDKHIITNKRRVLLNKNYFLTDPFYSYWIKKIQEILDAKTKEIQNK